MQHIVALKKERCERSAMFQLNSKVIMDKVIPSFGPPEKTLNEMAQDAFDKIKLTEMKHKVLGGIISLSLHFGDQYTTPSKELQNKSIFDRTSTKMPENADISKV